MLGRTAVTRFVAFILAAAQAVAPGIASLVDARPAAQAQLVQHSAHVDAPGTSHGIAHPDRCSLCGAATRVAVGAQPSALIPTGERASLPAREARDVAHDISGRGTARSRAPPIA